MTRAGKVDDQPDAEAAADCSGPGQGACDCCNCIYATDLQRDAPQDDGNAKARGRQHERKSNTLSIDAAMGR